MKTQEQAQWTPKMLLQLGRKAHTPESWGRAILVNALKIAAGQKKGIALDRPITIKGHITIQPKALLVQAEGGGYSGCVTGQLCWEDEDRQQSVCEDVEVCSDEMYDE